jgi:hypothetical protein
MGSIHRNQCVLASTAPTPFAPPPDAPPYYIYTPDASPIGLGTPKNALNTWLIVYGSVFLIVSLIQVGIFWIFEYDNNWPRYGIVALHLLWSIAWIIYGGILLFSKNGAGQTCRHSVNKGGFRVWQTTLGMWVLMLLGLPGLFIMMLYACFD